MVGTLRGVVETSVELVVGVLLGFFGGVGVIEICFAATCALSIGHVCLRFDLIGIELCVYDI